MFTVCLNYFKMYLFISLIFSDCLLCCAVFGFVQLFVTPWTAAHQAPLSIVFSRKEYWSGLPIPPPGDLPNPGFEYVPPLCPALQEDSLPWSHLGSPMDCVRYQLYDEN